MVLKLCCLLAIVTFGSCHVRSGRVPRQAVPPSGAWGVPPTNKTIAYRLDALTMSSKEKEELLAAIKYWSENTCIDFREARAEDEFVATFIKTGRCHSPVGRSSIAVNAGCGFIRDVHEIQHLLGISHTHVRSDRDKFIKIDQERMKRLNITQYVMKPNYDLFGVPYDYGSILHYGAGPRDDPYFVPTLSVYDRTPGILLFPSFYDVLLANMINLCNETCHESAVKCENGGYIHPRDCSKCVCPLGFTGRTCSEILIIGSCGGILNASDQWQSATIQMNLKDMTFDIFNRSYCSWHIKAPPGKKIEINLTEIETNVDCNHYQVCYAGFEFKIALDPRLTGPKFCCSSHLPRMVSQLNTVPIIGAIDDFYPMNSTTSFTYRFVDGSTNSTLPDDYGIPLEASEPVTTTSTATTTESRSTTTTTESPSTTTTAESPSTTTTTESTSTTTTTESPSTTTTTESTSTTTTTESPSTTTTTESPSTTTTTESPSTTTTTESPSTTTTTSEAPTRQLPKTTTTDSTIVQSTANAMSTGELSTLPTTDTSTELLITTNDSTDFSTTENRPTITHLSPTTTELSTESTNDVPIDCTTTYETSTTDVSTKTDPTTVDDSTVSTQSGFSATSTTTKTESPTATTTTEARTAISARKSTIITTQLPTSTSPSNEKCAPNLPCSEGYLCNFRAGICERYAKNCTELKCNADEYCEMQYTRCDATECDLRPLCLNRDPRAPMTCRNHLCSKDSMCLMCPLCGNIPTCVDPTPVIVSRPFVYCGPNEPCAQGSLCNYKTGRCEPRVYPTPGNG